MPPMPPLFRIDVLDRLMERLSELKGVLCELDTFRFYTSSLLITYDGGNGSNHGGSEEEEEVPSQSLLLKCNQWEGLFFVSVLLPLGVSVVCTVWIDGHGRTRKRRFWH